jgi:hypothetical protein
MDLTNSKRMLFSASHLSSKLTEEERRRFNSQPSGALNKINLLRALNIPQVSHAQLSSQLGLAPAGMERHFGALLSASTRLAERPAAHLDVAQSLAHVPDAALLAFAKVAGSVTQQQSHVALLSDLYELQTKISPVGRLYLERLEMFPIGVERGEMVFTVPMAPGESTTISHKEWSVSTRGYEDVVQDFFESYSEKGVSEKTDTSTAAENEVHQSNTLNFGATLSGSYGPVSLTTNLGVTSGSDERQSIKTSMQRNREVTEKSSARVRQEHKVSIKIETKQGMDQTSYKTITNPSADAVRIDYYKMMRKWRTDLYRYGLRMTYDITVPTPGVRLWARWRRIAEIDKQLATPLQFGWAPKDINEGWIHPEALKLGILVEDAPPIQVNPPPVFDVTPYFNSDDSDQTRFGQLAFDVPAGYSLASADFTADMAVWAGKPQSMDLLNASDASRVGDRVSSSLPEHVGHIGHQVVSYAYRGISQAQLRVEYTCMRLTSVFEEWQKAVWHQMRDAADARHREELGRLQEERDTLWRALVGKDTLSLRRLEREEMLRLIMLWLLGPDAPYANAPSWIEATVDQMLKSEIAFQSGTVAPATPSPTFAGMDGAAWAQAVLFGDMVKFVQQAVEWENLLYFLYPYFWGGEAQGRDKMLFEHPDPEHQNFLRAGYCRVVITVRPGFEADFTRLVETGSLGGSYTSPYLPIAEEIANRARTNYAGIPPANPEKHARPLLYPQQRRTWEIMEQVIAAIEQHKTDSGDYPASLADLPVGLTTTDAWGNPLVYSLPGSGNDYDLISLGSDNAEGGEATAADISAGAGASLMASWFDYTPTSGIDIVVNSKPEVIS